MNRNFSLPKDYQPFPKLVICSNTLINVDVPIIVEENFPILIGKGEPVLIRKGEKTKIWLNLSPGTKGKSWQPLIRANRPLHKSVKVHFEDRGTIFVYVGNSHILTFKEDDIIPEITHLDLRPIGLNIYGNNKDGLNVGTKKLMGNIFQDVQVMLGNGLEKRHRINPKCSSVYGNDNLAHKRIAKAGTL
jgi:hypothetical protein